MIPSSKFSKVVCMTAEFQAVLADIVTNECRAKLYFDHKHPDKFSEPLTDDVKILSSSARRRLLVLASLLSQRRFARTCNLLPASKQLLGDLFITSWRAYLESVPAGMPSATQEAADYAKFLNKVTNPTSLEYDVLHYEICLNEVSRRLHLSEERQNYICLSRPLSKHHYIQLSPFVLVARFSYDAVAIVQQLRLTESIGENKKSFPQSVIFHPRKTSGLSVDVSIIPGKLASLLHQTNTQVKVSELIDTETIEMQQVLLTKLDYLIRAGVLRLFSPTDVLTGGGY